MKFLFASAAAVVLASAFPLARSQAVSSTSSAKVVVLTFDDSSASHHSIAAPLLKRYGFGATFFITEGFTFRANKRDYMTWEQIAELHRDGFEIGNHTRITSASLQPPCRGWPSNLKPSRRVVATMAFPYLSASPGRAIVFM